MHPLKQWREDRGTSADDFGTTIGTTRQAVHRYEAGKVPSPPVMAKIIAATDGEVTADDWFREKIAKAAAPQLELGQ